MSFIISHPLGKKHTFRVLYRFIYWQLESRRAPDKLIVKLFIPPVKFYARKGLTGITGNIYTGLHDFYDMSFLLHFLRPADTFYDIGANVGSYSLLASGICGAQTFAFEPCRDTMELLGENVVLNNLQHRITIIHAAVGSNDGEAYFTHNEDTKNHIIANDELFNTAVAKVKVMTADSLNNNPVLVKIDVEGFETEVLKGMAEIIKQTFLKVIIIELNGSGIRYGFLEDTIHLQLMNYGFKPYKYDPFNRSLAQLNRYGIQNTIYCRDMEFVNERIKTGRHFKVMGEKI